jgi:hypothetical protein
MGLFEHRSVKRELAKAAAYVVGCFAILNLDWSGKMRSSLMAVFVAFVSLTHSASALAQADPSGVLGIMRRQPAEPVQPAPRLADGKVNLGRPRGEKGIWALPVIANFALVAGGVPKDFRGNHRTGSAAEPHIPFQPWAAAVYDYNSVNLSKYDPEGYCLPPGGPRQMATPFPMEIIQLPEEDRIIIIFEGGAHVWREVYMDGRPHPPNDSIQSGTYMGHSVGRWEGDTLVIDSVGYNEGTWLDQWGHPHTDQLHVIERITRPNKNTLHYEATIDDPAAYTKPWTIAWDIQWAAKQELREYICQENNIWIQSLHDDLEQPVFYERPPSLTRGR